MHNTAAFFEGRINIFIYYCWSVLKSFRSIKLARMRRFIALDPEMSITQNIGAAECLLFVIAPLVCVCVCVCMRVCE